MFPQGYVKPPDDHGMGLHGANLTLAMLIVAATSSFVFLMHSLRTWTRILKMCLMPLHYALSLAKQWCR